MLGFLPTTCEKVSGGLHQSEMGCVGLLAPLWELIVNPGGAWSDSTHSVTSGPSLLSNNAGTKGMSVILHASSKAGPPWDQVKPQGSHWRSEKA